MINKAGILILLASCTILLGLASCEAAKSVPAPTVNAFNPPTQEPIPLATPYAELPAAGICASFEGELVSVTLNPDVPDPRCSKVKANQKLEVTNQTTDTLKVSIGNFEASLAPGGAVVFDTPFGDYLEVGVHHLQVEPCCGPELWLEANP